MQKLLTTQIEKTLEKFPLYSQDKADGMDAKVIVKFFNPIGAGTWYVTEGEKQDDGDWLFFGYCHITDAEFGYFRLSDLQSIRLPYGMRIERDSHTKMMQPLKSYL